MKPIPHAKRKAGDQVDAQGGLDQVQQQNAQRCAKQQKHRQHQRHAQALHLVLAGTERALVATGQKHKVIRSAPPLEREARINGVGTPSAPAQRHLERQQLIVRKTAAHLCGQLVEQLGDDGVGVNGRCARRGGCGLHDYFEFFKLFRPLALMEHALTAIKLSFPLAPATQQLPRRTHDKQRVGDQIAAPQAAWF